MKKIIVFGLARSGIATISYLSKLDYQIQISDDEKESLDKIHFRNVKKCYNISDIDWKDIDALILSPGVALYFPKAHPIILLANKNKVKIICDIEYFYQLFPDQNYIAITGSNGKSTVTTLISDIFSDSEKQFDFGGNIGRAVFDMKILPKNSNYILEISSYQLDMMYKTRLKIAILLNITPDHLDRHGNFENYIQAKKRIFQNQEKNDFAVIGIDNLQTNKIYEELKHNSQFKAKLIPFSINKILENGFSIQDQIIYQNGNKIANLENKILIKGQHNLENILASFITCYISNIDLNIIIKNISEFSDLKHRMQFVKKINNVNFINDSKATNLESTIAAIKSFKNIYLILGGKIKNDNFNLLLNYQNHIKKIYLIGSSTDKLYQILSHRIDCHKSYNLEVATNQSYFDAKSSSKEVNILFSPAAASFDQWKNFEERGDNFIKFLKFI